VPRKCLPSGPADKTGWWSRLKRRAKRPAGAAAWAHGQDERPVAEEPAAAAAIPATRMGSLRRSFSRKPPCRSLDDGGSMH